MPSDRIDPPSDSLPPPTGEAFYYITPEEGGADDVEAMWLAEDFLAEAEGDEPPSICSRCGLPITIDQGAVRIVPGGSWRHSECPVICSLWWRAPRIEVPDSVDVNHVCGEPMGHRPPHRCGCGVESYAEH